MGRGGDLLFNPPKIRRQTLNPKPLGEIALPPLTLDFLEKDGQEIVLAENHYSRKRGEKEFSFRARDVNSDLPFSLTPHATAWLNDGDEDPGSFTVIVQEEDREHFLGVLAPTSSVKSIFASDQKLYCQTSDGLYFLGLEEQDVDQRRQWKRWDREERISTVPGLYHGARKAKKLLPGRDGALLFFRKENQNLYLTLLDNKESDLKKSMTIDERFLDISPQLFSQKSSEETYAALGPDLYILDFKKSGQIKYRSYPEEILSLSGYGDRLLLLLANQQLVLIDEDGREATVPLSHRADKVYLNNHELITRLGDFAWRFAY